MLARMRLHPALHLDRPSLALRSYQCLGCYRFFPSFCSCQNLAIGPSLRFDYRCVGSPRQACLFSSARNSRWLCSDSLRCLHLPSGRARPLLPRHLPLRYLACMGVPTPFTFFLLLRRCVDFSVGCWSTPWRLTMLSSPSLLVLFSLGFHE